jgi:hypothetical protein
VDRARQAREARGKDREIGDRPLFRYAGMNLSARPLLQ